MKSRKIQSQIPLPLSVEFSPPPPLPPPPPSPPVYSSPIINYESKISPNVLLIIIILAIVFFISGLLHLLIRYLMRPSNREPEAMENFTVMQGQLQQLFHLHDSGVDQSFIDSLPVFLYKAIIGLKDPFDCAVCLCEFEGDDKLRLLPKCSHAFHIECIDTWLLSHSTCPLCRRSLLSDFSSNNGFNSPIVLVLESASSESSREIASDLHMPSAAVLNYLGEEELVPSNGDGNSQKPVDVVSTIFEPKVVQVKLGKFKKNIDESLGGEGSSHVGGKLDQRRCYSMGSYEYVMNETSSLRVAVKPAKNKKPAQKKPGHRFVMSECDSQSRRYIFRGVDASRRSIEMKVCGVGCGNTSVAGAILKKKESHSISKIWMRTNGQERCVNGDCSRRAFSFRLPFYRTSIDESKPKKESSPDTASEFNVSTWEKSASEMDFDVEAGSCGDCRVSRSDEAPSFARRTLLWISGRQNRVGNQQ